VELWSGGIAEFVRTATAGAIVGDLLSAFYRAHGRQPSPSEVRSWENSLRAMAQVGERVRDADVGVSVEYHLPLSDRRIDVVLFGQHPSNGPCALVVELKQWSDAALPDEFSENVVLGTREHVHPSRQAAEYAGFLNQFHTAFHEGGIRACAAAYCHNLEGDGARVLEDERFASLLADAPLFTAGEPEALARHVQDLVGGGSGLDILARVGAGRFKPSKGVVAALDEVLNGDGRWHLLDDQRVAYNRVFAEVERAQRKRSRSVVIVRGGPGTGKSVVAVQLLADAARKGFAAAHSTGSKAFTLVMQSKFPGAKRLFVRNSSFKNEKPLTLDLLLVDEAHRVRRTSDTFRTPKLKRAKQPQVDELIDAAKVTVFLLDENQFVRPDEIGRTALFEEAAKRRGLPVLRYDLGGQFRCGGCLEYVKFVDWLLGFESEQPPTWGAAYDFALIENPRQLDAMMDAATAANERARLVAGYCWPWSDPAPDGSLADDVVIALDGQQTWARPWNRKEQKGKSYTPKNHPYTLWADTDEGLGQVGCVYSAQGFEFDRVGVIWGEDLVWRTDRWVAQKRHSYDKPVKAKNADTLLLVRNAYRVLLTRGIRSTRLLCLDEETRAHVRVALAGLGSGSVAAD
jgi:hypothetical protein